MKSNTAPLAYILFFLLFLRVSSGAQTNNIQRVWAVDDGERIKKTALNHPLATSANNKVWSAATQTISLFGARNEFVAFQLIIQARSGGAATNVNVKLDSLRKTTSPVFTISNQGWNGQAFNYVNRHIEMFVMHYMNIDVRTNQNYVWWGSGRPGATGDPVWSSSDFLGWHGEQLVPFEAPSGPKLNGQGGAPFTVTANQNQCVWVDVYIPKTAPAGDYTGTLRVTEGGVDRYTLNVALKVYDFALSDTTHFWSVGLFEDNGLNLRHRIGSTSNAAFHTMIKRWMQFGRRHRLHLQRVSQTPSSHWQHLKEAYTGQLFTQAQGYFGPGEGMSPEKFYIGVWDQPRKVGNTDNGYKTGFGDVGRVLQGPNSPDSTLWKSYWWSGAKAWADSFKVYAPYTHVEKYGAEEITVNGNVTDTSGIFDVRRKSRWLATNPNTLARAVTHVKSDNFTPLMRAILLAHGGTFDLATSQAGWTDGAAYNPWPRGFMVDSVANWRALGIPISMYSGTRPGMPVDVIDAPAIDWRARGWIMWKHDIQGYRVWMINGKYTVNIWEKDWKTTSGTQSNWGDGTLIYSGQEQPQFSGDDRNWPGPIAGVRLKNWRRGVQDYQYLKLAQQLSLNTAGIVTGVVNKVGSQLAQYEPVPLDGWAQRGHQYENARRQLAELIDAANSPPPYGSFSASPSLLTSGPGNTTLTWSSFNATSASINQGIGSVPVNGSQVVFVDTTKTFVITLTNQLGTREYSVAVEVKRLPTGSLNAAPDTIESAGSQTTLTWTSTDALSASIDNGIGIVPLSGSLPISIQQTTTFTLILTNNDGQRNYAKTVLLRTLPSGSFQALPDTIPFDGDDIILQWTSSNATSARLNHGLGFVSLNGSVSLYLSTPSVFTLTLSSPFGSVELKDTVFQSPFSRRYLTLPPESLVVKDLVTNRIAKPVKRGRGLYPNWVNLLAEVVIQGGFQPGATESDSAGGLRVGVAHMERVSANRWRANRDSSKVRSWVRLSKWNHSRNIGYSYTSLQSSLEDRSGFHVGIQRGLDSTGVPGEPRRRKLSNQFSKLGPNKHNNRLYAELVALKFNIAASQLGKVPGGFGELVFDIDGHPLDEMSIREIAARCDTMMSYWETRSPQEYDALYGAVYIINRAFVAPLDTINFESGGQLKLRGQIDLTSVPFLKRGSAVPASLAPTGDFIEDGYEEFIDDEFEDDDLVATDAKLYQNYPNPFNPSTTIGFRLRYPSLASLSVYNILGQEVAVLLNKEFYDEGFHKVEFGSTLSSGVYFARLLVLDEESGEIREQLTTKMLLLR